MPAMLAEVSFVSSPADEQKLQSSTYRQQIAEALYKGIAHYAASFPKVKIAANATKPQDNTRLSQQKPACSFQQERSKPPAVEDYV